MSSKGQMIVTCVTNITRVCYESHEGNIVRKHRREAKESTESKRRMREGVVRGKGAMMRRSILNGTKQKSNR